jgi:hypothetical protein
MTSDDEIKELKQRVASLEQKHARLDMSYLKNIHSLSQSVAGLQEENDKLAACDSELSPAEKIALLEQMIVNLQRLFWEDISYLMRQVAALQEKIDMPSAPFPDVELEQKLEQKFASIKQELLSLELQQLDGDEKARHENQCLSKRIDKLEERAGWQEQRERQAAPVADLKLDLKFESLKKKHESFEKRYVSDDSHLQHRVIMLRADVAELQREIKKLSALVPEFKDVEKLAHDAYIASSDAVQRALVDVAMAVPLAVDIPPEVSFNHLSSMREARALGIEQRRN